MSETFILPGDRVHAQHVNLKLGPGLLQHASIEEESMILSTKAGELHHSANNSKWWIEGNSRRASRL